MIKMARRLPTEVQRQQTRRVPGLGRGQPIEIIRYSEFEDQVKIKNIY